MEYSRPDIVIEVHLRGEASVDAKSVISALDTLEAALYASDRQDVERAASELRLPPIVKDAALERLRRYRNRRLLLRDARRGSLVLEGVVAAVALFVLKGTLGEAFKEGVKESDVFEDLKRFFRDVLDEKAFFISEYLRRHYSQKKRKATVRSVSARSGERSRVVVEIAVEELPEERPAPRSLGEELQD